MSSSLKWEPANREMRSLSTDLKFAMRKSYGEPVSVKLTANDLGYFKGLLDAGIKDAEIVIKAIDKHGEIVVREYY